MVKSLWSSLQMIRRTKLGSSIRSLSCESAVKCYRCNVDESRSGRQSWRSWLRESWETCWMKEASQNPTSCSDTVITSHDVTCSTIWPIRLPRYPSHHLGPILGSVFLCCLFGCYSFWINLLLKAAAAKRNDQESELTSQYSGSSLLPLQWHQHFLMCSLLASNLLTVSAVTATSTTTTTEPSVLLMAKLIKCKALSSALGKKSGAG